MAVITVSNQKGGIGKTTTCFYLAKNYLKSGKKVYCVDYDGQGDISKLIPDYTVSRIRPNELAELEADYVIVDTSPNLELTYLKLYKESDIVIIPTELERLDIENTLDLLESVKMANLNHKCFILVLHEGKHLITYKNLMPFIEEACQKYEVKLLTPMLKAQAVKQAMITSQTVFEKKSPPDVRNAYKLFHKEVTKAVYLSKDGLLQWVI